MAGISSNLPPPKHRLVVEICRCGSFVKINLTLKRKVFDKILRDKSHQIEYTKELSIK